MTAGLASLLGPPGSSLRRWRILLAAAVALGVLYLVGPYRPWRLEGHPSLIPQPGESRIHIILVAMYWAAALNTALCVLLLAASALWAGAEERPLGAAVRRRAPALALLLFAAAVVVAGALRWPLAHRGVWWDEAWSVRHTLVGTDYPDPHDETRLVFKPVSWANTLFYYRKPTNHVLYSILARTSLAGWRTLHGAAPSEWNEFALRLPAYAAA